MKYNSLYFLVFIGIILFLFSCKKVAITSADNDIKFDSIYSVKNYYINNDTTQPSCNLKINFVYPTSYSSEAVLDSLSHIFLTNILDESYDGLTVEKAVSAYENAYVENYKQDVNTYLKDQDFLLDHDRQEKYFSFYENISNKIVFNKANILSFVVNKTTYKGGASSYEYLENFSINLETGKLIMGDDIFNSGYEKFLSSLFKSFLLKENKVQSVSELENLGYFGIDEMQPNENFYLNENGVTYTFNKGTNSIYTLDAIEIFIPYKDLLSVLKENSIVGQFLLK